MVWGERKISLRFRFLNIALFLIASAVMAAVMLSVLQNVTKQVSVDYARYFAANAAGTLSAHFSREIALVSKAVSSREIINWFADENNYEKKLMAYDEIMETINKLYSSNLYAAMQKTLHEFTIDKDSGVDDIKVVATLDRNYFDDAWYFDCIASDMDYVLKVDMDKIHHRKLVWLNYKVVHNNIPLGVFSAGLNFSDVVEELFSNYDNSKIRSLIIDANGIIQMDSSLLRDADFLQYTQKTKIEEEFTDPAFVAAVNAWLKNINGYFEMGIEPTIIELSSGISSRYRYVTIAPIGSTNWSAVTLFDSSSLFSRAKLIPLFILMGFLFIAFAFATSIMGYRFLYKPAVELARSKDEFLAKMSHEIRTPMNAITGMAELALREDRHEIVREHILTIKQASANLLSIINDILDFSKIESGKLEIVPVSYRLSSLVNDTINIIRMRLMEKPIRFFTNIDGNIPNNLFGDETRLRQIFLNLLTNAIKYSEKGVIGLTITTEKQNSKQVWIKIAVSDTGKGIKQEDKEKLFDEFVKVDLRNNQGIEGTGLGLAITKRLCAAMEGEISFESEYGKGSVFTAVVPQIVESDTPFAAVEEPDKKKILVYEGRSVYASAVCWTLKNLNVPYTLVANQEEFAAALYREEWFYVFSSYGLYDKIKPVIEQSDSAFYNGIKPPMALMVEWGTEAYVPGVRFVSIPIQSLSIANILNGKADSKDKKNTGIFRFSFPGARLLVVDDIATNLKVVEGLLTPYKTIVDTCTNGLQAIEFVKNAAIRNRDYDIVFMDHMMPGMDGIETTAAIREWENEQNETIKVNSAKSDTQSSDRYLRRQIPIIALTANAVVGMREIFIEKGFNDFISKPIDVSKLDEILNRWIPEGKRKEEKEKKEDGKEHVIWIKIHGVDTAKGISLTGGTPDAYLQVLALFLKDVKDRLPLFQEVPNVDNMSIFITNVHALKSASASLGATEISTIAAELEAAGKAADMVFINKQLPVFEQQLAELAHNIETVLKTKTSENQNVSQDNAPLPIAYYKLFNELADAIKTKKSADIDRLLEELNRKPLDTKTRETLNEISDEILMTEFDNALKIIEELLR
jgi:signal transduction histidine kinase/CheY-like chemotaxis protein/HPt (histidine-containing phosphotransfer) domain-containing protein